MKMNNFRGDLTDNAAKTKPLCAAPVDTSAAAQPGTGQHEDGCNAAPAVKLFSKFNKFIFGIL